MPDAPTAAATATNSTVAWLPQGSYQDVLFDLSDAGIARIRINRPAKRNAFRPQTVMELYDAFSRVRDNPRIGVVLFSGVGPPPMVVGPSARVVIRASAAMGVTSVTTACPG